MCKCNRLSFAFQKIYFAISFKNVNMYRKISSIPTNYDKTHSQNNSNNNTDTEYILKINKLRVNESKRQTFGVDM